MSRYIVKTTVVLSSASAVVAIFRTLCESELFAIQSDVVSLLKHSQVVAQLKIETHPPYGASGDTLLAVCDERLTLITAAANGRVRQCKSDFEKKIDLLCNASDDGCFFLLASGCELHRHDVDGGRHSLLKVFDEPLKALSATEAHLLIMLSTSFRVVNMNTNEDVVEIPCDVSHPIEIFWSVSSNDLWWFMAIVKPGALDQNRTHKLFMGEVDYKRISSEDVALEDVSLDRSLKCTVKSNKMLTLAENGNVILIHQIDNFKKLDLLYRGEATDSIFTSAEIVRVSTGVSAPPRIALGTANGAIAFLDEASETLDH